MYSTPELSRLGSLASLTLGMNGSCPDGGGLNNTQLGGASDCGISGGNTGKEGDGSPPGSSGG